MNGSKLGHLYIERKTWFCCVLFCYPPRGEMAEDDDDNELESDGK